MTFLNPFLLFGLAAAALPLLIHLLNLRRLQTIEFSSLRFLKELQQTRIRRLKIRQILLLVVRTLLIIFLVLTFSRPALEGNLAGPVGTTAKSTLVILLDDSPSMGVRNESGVMFAEGVEAARQIVGLANPGDEVFLQLLSEMRSTETTGPLSPDAVEDLLLSAQPTHLTTPLAEAMARVREILAVSRNINKEFYLISDMQETQIVGKSNDSTVHFPDGVRTFLAEIPGPTSPRNLGISSLSADAQVITPDRPIAFDAQVVNGGPDAEDNTVLSVYLDGTRTSQQSVTLEGGGSASHAFAVVPKKSGFHRGTVELEEDMLDLDNRRYFTLEVPEQIHVGLVGTPDETRYLRLALEAERSLSGEEFLVPERIDESAIGATNLARYDVLLLSNIRDLTSQEGERLIRFVTAGGGLAVFPGSQTDLANISTNLLHGLGIPPLTSIASLDPSAEGRVTFSRTDSDHPLFAGLFDDGSRRRDGGIESPLILNHVLTSVSPRGNTVIGLSDGSPFLVEYSAGAGRMMFFAVGLDLAWSDFPLKGIFAPLLHRSSVYLATGHVRQEEAVVGSPVTIRVRITTGQEAYSLRTPDDLRERVRVELNPVTGMTDFISGPTHRAGIYELVQDGGETRPIGMAAVNIDPRESNLAVASEETIREFLGARGMESISFVHDPESIGRVVTESRFGIELWRFMLSAAIFLALCEMAIARTSRREMHTDAGGR